ncbi:MAG TPA: 6-bladed beta-propeller [Gammaproteobacteria bacterium]|nr:6-bladed beta-propeller [Gammaproteobacteria bacterium]
MFYLPHKMTKINRHHSLILLTIALLAGCAGDGIRKQAVELVYPPAPDEPRFYFERTITSSFDVKETTAVDSLRQFATGTMGSASGLGKPYGVAAHQGRIYVTDTVKRAILMFDVPGKDFKLIGTEGPGKLRKPIGIDTAKSGDIYVADNSARRAVVFDKDGNFLRAFGGQNLMTRPSGIAVSPDETRAYVIDTGGIETQEHHLLIFDAQTGEHLKTIGTRGRDEGDFNLALQVTTAPDGTVYVTDSGNFRVQAFDRDGNFKLTFGSVGRKSGQFARPKGIASDGNGNIYVADAAFGNFQIFDSQGRLLMFIGDRSQTPGPGRYMLPAGIAVDEDGRVYIVDQFFRKVDIFRPAGIETNQGYLGGEHYSKPPKGS